MRRIQNRFWIVGLEVKGRLIVGDDEQEVGALGFLGEDREDKYEGQQASEGAVWEESHLKAFMGWCTAAQTKRGTGLFWNVIESMVRV